LENQLREEILNSNVKADTQANVFEVNRNRGNSITFGQSRLQRLSFEFILMLDMLCLPIFTDQSILLPTVMEEIVHTSAELKKLKKLFGKNKLIYYQKRMYLM